MRVRERTEELAWRILPWSRKSLKDKAEIQLRETISGFRRLWKNCTRPANVIQQERLSALGKMAGGRRTRH